VLEPGRDSRSTAAQIPVPPRQPGLAAVGLREASNVTQLYNEMQHAGPMPDVPLIILCSMTTDAFRELYR
jgi:hypothetical protein